MRRLMVAGNWKMNGSLAMIDELVPAVNQSLKSRAESGAVDVDVVVCPPPAYLHKVSEYLSHSKPDLLSLGAQNVSEHAGGAYTGEVSTDMLAEFGCRFVIVGHSERRQYYGETDELVGEKAQAVLNASMTPVICIGETLEEREQSRTEEVVGRQLQAAAAVIGVQGLMQSVLAYEPVWAIGTGKTASGDQAQAVHAYLRGALAKMDTNMSTGTRILYGGSVKGDNAAELFAQPDIDGGLIGGASLKADDFLAIVQANDA